MIRTRNKLGQNPRIRPLDPLEEAELCRIEELLTGDGEGLADFIRHQTPHHLPPKHIAPIIATVERARHERIWECVSLPPRHAKTTTLSHGIAWWLKYTPADTCAYFTYSEDRALGKSGDIRDGAIAAGIQLNPAVANKQEWRTTHKGGLIAGGVGSGFTGVGAQGIILIDDPFKNPEEANSQLIRDKVWEWFVKVVLTRQEGASIIVVHTRWNEDDLIGRLTKEPYNWPCLNLPALAEPNDPLGRAVGEALWPERFPANELNDYRRKDEYAFASLFQGHPIAPGKKLFSDPTYYDPSKVDLTGCQIVIAADPAASVKTSADYSAIIALAVKGYGADMIGYVLDVYRRQVTVPQFARDLRDFQRDHGNAPALVEAVGGFKAVPQILREVDPNVLVSEFTPLGDKLQRAQPAASAWGQGRIMVPLGSPPWLNDFLQEVLRFTGIGDRHDDQVDCLSTAWNEAQDRPAPYIPPRNPAKRRI